MAALASGDLPAHTHAGTDITSAALHTVLKAAASIGTRRGINLIEGGNVTLTVADDAGQRPRERHHRGGVRCRRPTTS